MFKRFTEKEASRSKKEVVMGLNNKKYKKSQQQKGFNENYFSGNYSSMVIFIVGDV